VLGKYEEGKGKFSDVMIWDALVREWSTLYPSALEPPSLDTVRGFLQRVPESLRDALRLPRQEHDQKNAPYLVTNIAAVAANGIWVSDHRIYDVLVYNDCFEGAEGGAAIRLWETCIMDMRTRVIVGSVWNVNPSSRTIADALFMAIRAFSVLL
jgi:transposase InsO family protein